MDLPFFKNDSKDNLNQVIECLSNGCRHLVIKLPTEVEPKLLWEVLTDYDNLNSFIPNLALSNLVWRRNNIVSLEQVGSQQLLGLKFSAKVILELIEYPDYGRLEFSMLAGDFRRFEGLWQIEYTRKYTTLVYELTVQGCKGMPISLIEHRLKNDIIDNLKAICKEAKRKSVG